MAENFKRPVFCLVFDIANEHIMKSLGLLSWGMMEYHGYDSVLATFDNGEYPNMKYIPGVRMEFIPRITGDFARDSVSWLRKNAKKIDVMHVYHMNRIALSKVLTYKFFNPRGKVYLKMDGCPMPYHKKAWMHPTSYALTKLCKCISTEIEENSERLSKAWGRKIIWVSDPANPQELQEVRTFFERSNVIITVGRLGSKQKATEILLEAFARIAAKVPNWKLKLVGRIEENLNVASDFYAKYPDLKERVIFVGEVRERSALLEIYRDAKIFALPTRWESFCFTMVEAMTQGCFAVMTRIPESERLTENFRFAFGSDIDDVDGFAKNLLYACTHESEIEKLAREGREATLKRCDLRRCCEIINQNLN